MIRPLRSAYEEKMENTDAKVMLMIEDLSRDALLGLLDYPITEENSDYLKSAVRQQYETGEIPAEEITAAWNDDTWNGKA